MREITCYWCRQPIDGIRYAEMTINGTTVYFHTSVAPLGKNCHNEFMQEWYEKSRKTAIWNLEHKK